MPCEPHCGRSWVPGPMSEPDRSGIVLVGMPGSGKSTVGQLVAQRLGVPHLDTDELAERRIGMPVPAYIERHGEAAFRVEEAEAVREACATPGAIISTGGGAALDPLNRWALWQHGTVAWLDLEPERLNERLRSDGVARPTLQPYSTERTSAVLASRSAVYRAADLRIEAGGTPDSLATEVMNGMRVTSARRLLDAEVPRHHPMGGPTARVVMGVELDECPGRRGRPGSATAGPAPGPRQAARNANHAPDPGWGACETHRFPGAHPRVAGEAPRGALDALARGRRRNHRRPRRDRGRAVCPRHPAHPGADHLAGAGRQRHRRQGGGRPWRREERGRRLLATGRGDLGRGDVALAADRPAP